LHEREDVMIYELRTYELKLGRLADYLAIFETKGFPVLSRYAEPIGFWFSGPTETGFLDRVNHIWGYESVAARIERRTALYNDPAWIRDLVPAVSETFVRLRGQLMTLQPSTADRLKTALAGKTAKGPVVASFTPAGVSSSSGGIGRWTTITGTVGRTFALDHLSELDLEQQDELSGVERDIWRPARFSRVR
jgi:hypothetical protein